MKKLSHSHVEESFKKEGYILISLYKGSTKKLKFICPKGHKHAIPLSNFKVGARCPTCDIINRSGYTQGVN